MLENLVVIILAAGRGERFLQSGGKIHKLQATIGEKTVLQSVIESVKSSGLKYFVVNPGSNTSGIGDSISHGIKENKQSTGWLILPGDLPLVRPDSIKQVAIALEKHTVVLPYYGSNQGHPVGFDRKCYNQLTELSGDCGASKVVRFYRHAGEVGSIYLDDEGIVSDVDTVMDLARLEKISHRV